MLSPGNILGKTGWFPRARLWRLILLQDPSGGFWDPTPGLGLALQACRVRPPPRLDPSEPVLTDPRRIDRSLVPAATRKAAQASCPLSGFDWEAVAWSVPAYLREVEAATAGAVPAERVWCTCLAAAALQRLDESWLASDPAAANAANKAKVGTVVDRAHAFLDSLSSEFPSLQLAAPFAAAMADADLYVVTWQRRQLLASAELRKVERGAAASAESFSFASQLMRVAGQVYRAASQRHDALNVLLAPPGETVKRWQRCMVLFTVLLAGLAVQVWLFWCAVHAASAALKHHLSCLFAFQLNARVSHLKLLKDVIPCPLFAAGPKASSAARK